MSDFDDFCMFSAAPCMDASKASALLENLIQRIRSEGGLSSVTEGELHSLEYALARVQPQSNVGGFDDIDDEIS